MQFLPEPEYIILNLWDYRKQELDTYLESGSMGNQSETDLKIEVLNVAVRGTDKELENILDEI